MKNLGGHLAGKVITSRMKDLSDRLAGKAITLR